MNTKTFQFSCSAQATSRKLWSLFLLGALASAGPLGAREALDLGQLKASGALSTTAILRPERVAYLAVGKTQGKYHLVALVRPDHSVFLRWANTEGEMPTEGVVVWRQREGDTQWKPLNATTPVAFFQGRDVESKVARMAPEKREKLLSFFHGEVTEEAESAAAPSAKKQGGTGTRGGRAEALKVEKLKPAAVLAQYRSQRQAGKVQVAHMQLMQVKADLDTEAADLLGLQYVDTPERGARYQYKIVVTLPEGGVSEALFGEWVDPEVATPVPVVSKLVAKSANGSVLLDWEAPESRVITGYNLYRAEAANGSFRRLNEEPIKKVQLEVEDPELAVRRALRHAELFQKAAEAEKGKPLSEEKREKYSREADLALEQAGSLPVLGAQQRQRIAVAVKEGRLMSGGFVQALSTYTDSIGREGNSGFENEKTYYYKVCSVDISGVETPLEEAPGVSGTPKDLEPPLVPTKPTLQSKIEALTQLKAVNQGRPQAARAARLSHMPVKELRALGEASQLFSSADGTPPEAKLVWSSEAAPDFKEYVIYRAAGAETPVRIGTSTTAAWKDRSLAVGVAYRYSVSALDKLGNESARSEEAQVQVRDGGLKQKLTLTGVQGVGQSTAPAFPTLRSFLRPLDWKMTASSLTLLKTKGAETVKLKTAVGLGRAVAFKTPREAVQPKVRLVGLKLSGAAEAEDTAGASGAASAAGLAPEASKLTVAKADFSTLTKLAPLAPNRHGIKRSFNPMLQGKLKQSAEIYAVLEWEKPVCAWPLQYQIYQAPQAIEIQRVARPKLKSIPASFSLGTGERSRGAQSSATVRSSGAAAKKQAASPAEGVKSKGALAGAVGADKAQGGLAVKTVGPRAKFVAASPSLRVQASKGIALSASRGTLAVATSRRDFVLKTVAKLGPGAFSLINEQPLSTERFVVSFPAEVAQYGGATYYYRVQARALEFEHLVEGPQGEVLEVRLPDIVPPPIPQVGSADLQEDGAEKLNVALTWTHEKVPDLAGFVVDRQEMKYGIKDGEVVAQGALQATPERVTPEAVTGLQWVDHDVAGGFYRYTLRAVDKTGNESACREELDIFVPAEARPAAPTGLSLSADTLTWQAAEKAQGYTVWRSFSGKEGDYHCVSPILEASKTSFSLPKGMKGQFRVVSRSASGRYQAVSEALR